MSCRPSHICVCAVSAPLRRVNKYTHSGKRRAQPSSLLNKYEVQVEESFTESCVVPRDVSCVLCRDCPVSCV